MAAQRGRPAKSKTDVAKITEIKATIANIPDIEAIELNKDTLVDVINNTAGSLVYYNHRTGYKVNWDEPGETQQIYVEDLLAIRNSQVDFYKKNWLEFPTVIEARLKKFLRVDQYYKNSIPTDQFADLFNADSEEITDMISKLPESNKQNLALMAIEMIGNRELYNLKTIDAIEKGLGYKITQLDD